MSSQAKKAFPQYNCTRYFMEPSSMALIFNFSAEGEYVQVESVDVLR